MQTETRAKPQNANRLTLKHLRAHPHHLLLKVTSATRRNSRALLAAALATATTFGLNVLRKWVHTNVRLTISEGERLDEFVVTRFLASAEQSLHHMQRALANGPSPTPSPTPSPVSSIWLPSQDVLLTQLAGVYGSGGQHWKHIANNFEDTSKSARMCAVRWEELNPVEALQRDRVLLAKYLLQIHTKSEAVVQATTDAGESEASPPNRQHRKKRNREMERFGAILKRTFRKLYYNAHTETVRTRIGLVYHLMQRIPNENVLEFLKGGHAIVDDKGALYVKVVTTEGSHPRTSSHYPQFKNAPHYGITINVPHIPTMHMLTGIVRRQNRSVSWVQLESSPMPSLLRLFAHEGIVQNVYGIVAHTKDYIAHRHTKKQYGPLGASWFTEKGENPHIIQIR